MRIRKNIKSEKGLTLIEAAIALAILGIMIGGLLSLYDRAQDQALYDRTHQNMKTIVSALSTYVETFGRLPCPADPARNDAAFGWEWNVTPAMATTASAAAPIGTCSVAANEVTGIVPFQTLNLPPDAVLDGWGNYFTYAVSPVFTLDNDANVPNAAHTPDDNFDRVHERCRNHAWVDILDNINAVKARFCCAGQPDPGAAPAGIYHAPATDLIIQDHTTGLSVGPPQRFLTPPVAPTVEEYEVMTQENDDANQRPIVSTNIITTPAFVLVSHGQNGFGAFLANNTANQLNITPAFANELENWDLDRTFFTGPANLNDGAPATYFDDIVLWMTQDGIMAANGTSSCQYP